MSTLILSGWTQPADALREALPEAETFDYSDYESPYEAISELKKHFAHTTCVVGWSLGGQLAVRAIAAGALAPKHLTLIAAPWQFVRKPGGMDPLTFTLFRESYRRMPHRTMARFDALMAKGDRDTKTILRAFRHHEAAEDVDRWLPWLDALAEASLASADVAALPPTLLIHGANDAIVPPAQAAWFEEWLPNIAISYWQETGHAPHLHDPKRLREEIAAHRAALKVAA